MGMPVITSGVATCEDAAGNIIESIAMEEAALAHILNAESEKLMAALSFEETTVQELMAINLSIKSTINAITQLEMILQAKLDLLRKIICA